MKRYKFKKEPLLEMANLGISRTGLSKGVIYISNRQGKHGARIKYYRNNPGKSPSTSISIDKNPKILIDKLDLTAKEIKELILFVKLNYNILINYWEKGETMLIDDILEKIKPIN